MKNESQPMSTKNDVSLNQSQFKNRLLAKYIAIPLFLGITTPVLHTGCGTKGKLQRLEQTIDGQKETDKTQDNNIGSLNTKVQGIQNKLTEIKNAAKTQSENQIKTNEEQNKKIEELTTSDKMRQGTITQLQSAITELKQLNQTEKEPKKEETGGQQTRKEKPIEPTQSVSLELAELESYLTFLTEYRRSLPLMSHLGTTVTLLQDRAKKADNIAQKVLETSQAYSHSHKTGKTTKITIPQEKTFNFTAVLATITRLDPVKKIPVVDKAINQLKEKIKEKMNAINQTQNQNEQSSEQNPTDASIPAEPKQETQTATNNDQTAEKKPRPEGSPRLSQEPKVIYHNNEETIYVPNDYEYDIPTLARARTGERLNSIYIVRLKEGEFAIAYGAYIQKSRSRKTYAMVCASGPGAITLHVASGVVDVFAKPQNENVDAWKNHQKQLIEAQIKNQQRYYPSFPRNMTEDYVYKHNNLQPNRDHDSSNLLIEDLTGDNSQSRPGASQ